MSAISSFVDDLRSRMPSWAPRAFGVAVLVMAVLFPFTQQRAGSWLNTAVIALAYMVMALGLNTVAEYVGNEATMLALAEFGVDYAQGYMFQCPRPFADFFAGDPA